MPNLTVKEAKNLFNYLPDDAVIVIHGSVVSGLLPVKGKLVDGYLNPTFVEGKGKQMAVVFTNCQELSDGSVQVGMKI